MNTPNEEKNILGSILINPELMRTAIRMKLFSAYFAVFDNLLIFMEMQNLHEKRQTIDLISLHKRLPEVKASYLASLTDDIPFRSKQSFVSAVKKLMGKVQ